MFPVLTISEAEDGVGAVEEVKQQREMGVHFDFILIDFIMVLYDELTVFVWV